MNWGELLILLEAMILINMGLIMIYNEAIKSLKKKISPIVEGLAIEVCQELKLLHKVRIVSKVIPCSNLNMNSSSKAVVLGQLTYTQGAKTLGGVVRGIQLKAVSNKIRMALVLLHELGHYDDLFLGKQENTEEAADRYALMQVQSLPAWIRFLINEEIEEILYSTPYKPTKMRDAIISYIKNVWNKEKHYEASICDSFEKG